MNIQNTQRSTNQSQNPTNIGSSSIQRQQQQQINSF